MKGINCCGDCVYYSVKKHNCTRGAHIETDPKAPFYDDCPLPEVAPVVHGRWEPHPHAYGFERCSVCNDCCIWGDWADGKKWNYCPHCGAKMGGKDDG